MEKFIAVSFVFFGSAAIFFGICMLSDVFIDKIKKEYL